MQILYILKFSASVSLKKLTDLYILYLEITIHCNVLLRVGYFSRHCLYIFAIFRKKILNASYSQKKMTEKKISKITKRSE